MSNRHSLNCYYYEIHREWKCKKKRFLKSENKKLQKTREEIIDIENKHRKLRIYIT